MLQHSICRVNPFYYFHRITAFHSLGIGQHPIIPSSAPLILESQNPLWLQTISNELPQPDHRQYLHDIPTSIPNGGIPNYPTTGDSVSTNLVSSLANASDVPLIDSKSQPISWQCLWCSSLVCCWSSYAAYYSSCMCCCSSDNNIMISA